MKLAFLRDAWCVVCRVRSVRSAHENHDVLKSRARSARYPSRFLHFCLLPVACGLWLYSFPMDVLAATTQEVEEALTCQCGCGLTVHSCNHLQCGFAVPAKKTIAELTAQGQGKEEITTSFVSRYGEKVLSAPTTTGFNLAAWVTPFAALLAGGVLIGLMSFRWARRPQADSAEPHPISSSTDVYREQLKKELESFEG